ncbi:hypothetical protein BS17DRAFT_692291, partial [Gyrodon lividus]
SQDSLPQSVRESNPSSTKSWHSALAQSSFSICFTELCVLFIMLMCQGFNLLDPYVRLYSWRISLFLLLSTIIILIPASFCMVVTYRSGRSVPSASSIASAETALERVKSDLRQLERDLEEYAAAKRRVDGSWLSRVIFKRDSHHGSLQQEVIGLQALDSQMTTRVAMLKRNAEFAETFCIKILSRTWAVYCVCRICSSVINLLSPPLSADDSSSSYGDLIAHIVAYLLSLLPFYDSSGTLSVDIPSLSRHISLALVGVIIISSVRVVLSGVTRAFRITSRNISASLMLLLLAQLMGIYLLSTLVQLRTMFPPSHSSSSGVDGSSDGADTNLFSTLPPYSLFGGLFDWSFLLGAMGCVLARWTSGLVGGDDGDSMY